MLTNTFVIRLVVSRYGSNCSPAILTDQPVDAWLHPGCQALPSHYSPASGPHPQPCHVSLAERPAISKPWPKWEPLLHCETLWFSSQSACTLVAHADLKVYWGINIWWHTGGLMATALVNIAFGFGNAYLYFCVIWAFNGLLQVQMLKLPLKLRELCALICPLQDLLCSIHRLEAAHHLFSKSDSPKSCCPSGSCEYPYVVLLVMLPWQRHLLCDTTQNLSPCVS